MSFCAFVFRFKHKAIQRLVCVCSCLCERVKKRFPKPPSPAAVVYLFRLMTVFFILAWLHGRLDCMLLSLQMTSIWTGSIWHAFISACSLERLSLDESATFSVALLSSLIKPCFQFVQTQPSLWLLRTYLQGNTACICECRQKRCTDLFWGLELTIAPPSVCSYSHCRVSPPTWSRNTSLVFFFCLWALSSAWPWRPVGGESMCFVKRIYDLWVFSRWFSSAAARDDPWPGLCSSGLRMNGVTESVGLLLVAKAQVRKIRL